MRKWLLFLIPAVLLAGGMIAVLSTREREPEYGGKRLSEWVDGIGLNTGLLRPFKPETGAQDAAILNIGTNSLPYLLKWIRYEAPPWKTRSFNLINKAFRSAFRDQQNVRADGGMWALVILGPQAEAAIPSLAVLMNDGNAPNVAGRAVWVLSSLQLSLHPAALALTTNNSRLIRLQSLAALSLWGTNTAARIKYLSDTDGEVAGRAADGLGEAAAQAGVVVPALAKTIQDERPEVRMSALEALSRFVPQARPAVPALVALCLADPDPHLRQVARAILREIDPEALERGTR